MPSRRERGFTIAELMFGMVILVLIAVVLLNNLVTTFRASHLHKDSVFAFTTAQGILNELHALVESSGEVTNIEVDQYDDGTGSRPNLTIAEENGIVLPPDHLNSRNILRDGSWVWARRISVRPLPSVDNRNLRYVTVTILKRDGAGVLRPRASLSTVINSKAGGFPTTQLFDVYLLAVENIPGWWVNMEAIRSFVESTLVDLESRNPGLEFRTHWITKASYGRNQMYRPYVNVDVDTNTALPNAYIYPGLMPSGGINNYYSPGIIMGRMATDVGQAHGYNPVTNPVPYALADFYNHGMRLPDELALHQRRVQAVRDRKAAILAARQAGLPPPPELEDMSEEPTLRLLLEDMNTDPDKYRRSIVMNLHGELIPMPPIRNYSDAAKSPGIASLRQVRVVTHPEELRTYRKTNNSSGDDLVLRTYAYTADPQNYAGSGIMSHIIAVRVMGVNLINTTHPDLVPGVQIENCAGGVVVAGDDSYQPMGPAKEYYDATLQPNEMRWWSAYYDPGPGEEKFTTLYFWHTPVIAPPVADTADPTKVRGLFNNERSRLYGLEYVPSCTEAGLDFSRNLYAEGDGPKNTARWTIRIPWTIFDDERFVDNNGNYYEPTDNVRLTIKTHIYAAQPGDVWTTGTMWPFPNDPENLSTTYAWWGDTPDAVPITERSQFLGDPRHNPYKDLLSGDPDFGDGYNWYHDALDNNGENSVADYPGLDAVRLENEWEGRVRVDIPRLFNLYRSGLVETGSVYTTLTGWSYYYAAIGNEFGADSANGYPDSLPMDLTPFGAPGTLGYINNITDREQGGASTGGRRFVRSGGANHWWGMPWLGEFYPDSEYAQWAGLDLEGRINGNLVAGNTLTTFYRQTEDNCYAGSRFEAYGTAMTRSEQRTKAPGCTAMFNIGSVGSTFQHFGDNGATGTLVDAGPELAANYGLELPPTTTISRPWSLTRNASDMPVEFGLAPYSTNRFSASILHEYYDHSSGSRGSAIVQLDDPTGTKSAFIVVNGLDKTLELGTSELAKFAATTMVHTFFEAGETGVTNRLVRPARVTILSPTEIAELADPTDITIQHDIEWTRWDGEPYTTTTAVSFAEDESMLDYVYLYSDDNGVTWKHIEDQSAAEPGVKPQDVTYIHADAGAGQESHTWPVAATDYPQGSYLLRIECYTQNQQSHLSYHQARFYIDR